MSIYFTFDGYLVTLYSAPLLTDVSHVALFLADKLPDVHDSAHAASTRTLHRVRARFTLASRTPIRWCVLPMTRYFLFNVSLSVSAVCLHHDTTTASFDCLEYYALGTILCRTHSFVWRYKYETGKSCLRGRVVKGVGHLDHVWSYGVREVVSSIPDRGNIVGCVFHPTRWLVRFPHLNMPFLPNSEFI